MSELQRVFDEIDKLKTKLKIIIYENFKTLIEFINNEKMIDFYIDQCFVIDALGIDERY